jgi:hypothetical protein
MGFREQLKHAFAVDKPEDLKPTDEQKRLIDDLCRTIARRGMTTPMQIMLEVGTPYNYLLSQTMHFFRPASSALIWVFAPFLPKGISSRNYQLIAAFLEHRGALPYIRERVEHFEKEFAKREHGEDGCEDASEGKGEAR